MTTRKTIAILFAIIAASTLAVPVLAQSSSCAMLKPRVGQAVAAYIKVGDAAQAFIGSRTPMEVAKSPEMYQQVMRLTGEANSLERQAIDVLDAYHEADCVGAPARFSSDQG